MALSGSSTTEASASERAKGPVVAAVSSRRPLIGASSRPDYGASQPPGSDLESLHYNLITKGGRRVPHKSRSTYPVLIVQRELAAARRVEGRGRLAHWCGRGLGARKAVTARQ